MKVRIVTALMLLGAALGVLVGGARAADKDKDKDKGSDTRTGKVYKTPEAVFDAFIDAGNKKDFKTFVACLTDTSRDKMAGLMIFAGAMNKAFADFDKTGKAKKMVEKIDKIFDKHGLNKEKLDNLKPAPGADPKELQKSLQKVVGTIKDRPGFVADMLVAMDQGKPKSKPELKDVKITGDTATGSVVEKKGEKENKQPISFKKIGGSWKIELPDAPTRKGPPPPKPGQPPAG